MLHAGKCVCFEVMDTVLTVMMLTLYFLLEGKYTLLLVEVNSRRKFIQLLSLLDVVVMFYY